MSLFSKLLCACLLFGMILGWVGQGAAVYVLSNSMWNNYQNESIPQCSSKNRSVINPVSGLGACVNASFEDTIQRANRGELDLGRLGDEHPELRQLKIPSNPDDEPVEAPPLE